MYSLLFPLNRCNVNFKSCKFCSHFSSSHLEEKTTRRRPTLANFPKFFPLVTNQSIKNQMFVFFYIFSIYAKNFVNFLTCLQFTLPGKILKIFTDTLANSSLSLAFLFPGKPPCFNFK